MSHMETQAASAAARLVELKKQRESLLWEKYNVDSLTFDVMMARYPVCPEFLVGLQSGFVAFCIHVKLLSLRLCVRVSLRSLT